MKRKRSFIQLVIVLLVGIMNMSSSNELKDFHSRSINQERRTNFCYSNSNLNPQKGGSKNRLLFHPESGQCYPFGTKGPCGKNMIFYEHPLHPKIGFCDCDQGYKSQYPCSDHPVRRMIYLPKYDQCYPIFSQGPCLNGFWINFSSNSEPVCEWNPCLNLMTSGKDYLGRPNSNDNLHKFWFYDPKRKSCFKTLERGYCPVGLTLEVTHDSLIPKCRRKKACYGALTNIRSFLICRPGSRYSFLLRGCTGASTRPRKLHGIG